jgi:hypothetical protein
MDAAAMNFKFLAKQFLVPERIAGQSESSGAGRARSHKKLIVRPGFDNQRELFHADSLPQKPRPAPHFV